MDLNNIELAHPNIFRAKPETYSECRTLSSFMGKIRREGEARAIKNGLKDDKKTDYTNKYVGDMFELFVEYFLHAHGANDIVQVINVRPHPDPDRTSDDDCEWPEEDAGVDFTGTFPNGKLGTIQAKGYRMDEYLTDSKAHLTRFIAQSINPIDCAGFDVDPKFRYPDTKGRPRIAGKSNLLVITSGKGIHHKTEGYWCKNIRVINGSDIVQMVNDQAQFWTGFIKSWRVSMEKRKANRIALTKNIINEQENKNEN